jgi:hypothetical protein
VRRNGYYADPGLASAFDNLASAFATPSGADIAGYANAAAIRAKEARASSLFNNPNDPDFDRKNIAVGNYSPIASFYAQNQNDATTRRNADVSARSAANVANINNEGALARQFAQPVVLSDGQTAMLPAQTTEATGLPSVLGGNVTVNQGQTVARPDGSTVVGQAKPLTDSEIKAKILGTLPAEEQRAVAMQGVGVSPVVVDGNPVNVFTPDAVGKQPYAKDTRAPTNANYKTPAGAIGTATMDDNGRWIDTQTRAEIPAGSQTYSANLQGDKDNTGLGASTKNSIDSQLVDLALTDSTSKQLRSLITKNPGSQGIVGSIRGTVQDVLQAGGEVGQLFNVNMQKLKDDIAAGRVDPEVARKFANFDPSIPAVNMLETLLTAQVAKVLDPNGRVSNDRYEQVSKALGAGGFTGNAARTTATLDQLDKIIADRRSILAPVRPAAAAIGTGQPAATGGSPQRLKFNPATGAIE